MNQKSITAAVNPNSSENLPLNRYGFVSFLGGVFTAVIASLPVQVAEEVSLAFRTAKISVSVATLEAYAKSGTLAPKLRSFLLVLKAEAQEQFKKILRDPHRIDFVRRSQFLNLPTGALFLTKLGNLIQPETTSP